MQMNDDDNQSIDYELELLKWKCETQDKQMRGECNHPAMGSLVPPFQNIDYEKLGITGKISSEKITDIEQLRRILEEYAPYNLKLKLLVK